MSSVGGVWPSLSWTEFRSSRPSGSGAIGWSKTLCNVESDGWDADAANVVVRSRVVDTLRVSSGELHVVCDGIDVGVEATISVGGVWPLLSVFWTLLDGSLLHLGVDGLDGRLPSMSSLILLAWEMWSLSASSCWAKSASSSSYNSFWIDWNRFQPSWSIAWDDSNMQSLACLTVHIYRCVPLQSLTCIRTVYRVFGVCY